jgi:5'-nucleotidase
MTVRRATVVALVGLVLSMVGIGVAVDPGGSAAAPAKSRPLRILVTNDDGVGAEGIDAMVEALRRLPDVQVTVVAPARNQSGAGEQFTTTSLTATAAQTRSGYPATAVEGFPADSVLLALKSLLKQPPDIVVSGINEGQNIGELTGISGTVGAARTAARLGTTAIAVSQGLAPTIDYTYAARLVANIVHLGRAHLLTKPPVDLVTINVPTCPTIRGERFVPLGTSTRVASYTPAGSGVFQATVERRNLFDVRCDSTVQSVVDDIDAFTNGFAAITALDVDGTAGRP